MDEFLADDDEEDSDVEEFNMEKTKIRLGKCSILLSAKHFNKFVVYYRPHPKDGEGNVFSLFTTRWRYPSPRCFPRSFLGGGTSNPGSFPGHWSQVLSWGYPSPGWRGVPQSWLVEGTPGQGSPPLARSGWGTPWPGQDGVPPSQDRTGVPPPPQDRTAERALAMWQVVCLLRSHRRIFCNG